MVVQNADNHFSETIVQVNIRTNIDLRVSNGLNFRQVTCCGETSFT
jgi:hypothetical protein